MLLNEEPRPVLPHYFSFVKRSGDHQADRRTVPSTWPEIGLVEDKHLSCLLWVRVGSCGGLWRPAEARGGLWRPVEAGGGRWGPVEARVVLCIPSPDKICLTVIDKSKTNKLRCTDH